MGRIPDIPPETIHPFSTVFTEGCHRRLKDLAVDLSTTHKKSVLSPQRLCGLAVKWFYDGVERFGITPPTVPVCMQADHPFREPIEELDWQVVNLLISEEQYCRLRAAAELTGAESCSDMIRLSTHRFIGARETRQACAIELVASAQQVTRPTDSYFLPNVHITCP